LSQGSSDIGKCIVIRNVGMVYHSRESSLQALEDIFVEVDEGEFVSFVGPTGCGKTTLLKIIGGILEPTNGVVRIGDKSADEARRKRMFGFIFEDPILLPWRTAIDNVRLPLEIMNIRKNESDKICQELLRLVGLDGFGKRQPHELSRGMQQRVAIVRALSFNPSILLMDEPFANLDEITKHKLYMDFLALWRKQRKTVIFVTHEIREAIFLSDKVAVLSHQPGTIKKVVKIELPRPRKLEMIESVKFIEYIKRVRSIL